MIGIFGGTFDPVHLAHLRLALELLEQSSLTEIRFIPCKQPVHKMNAIANPQQRLEMLKLATSDQSQFIVDDREIKRDTKSYTVLTLQELTHQLSQTQLGLIIGADSLVNFTQWYQWENILELAKLLVIPRRNSVIETDSLPAMIKDNMQIIPLKTLNISSSDIRQICQRGNSARYLVPEAVWAYIQANHLYGSLAEL